MKIVQHTPGPWKVRKSLNPNNTDCYSVEIREDGWKEILCSHVGGCLDHPGGKRFQGSREANASLISAAPELLEALELLRWEIVRWWPGSVPNDLYEAAQKANKAIAKAKRD